MFIKHESQTETVVELDRVEIALLFCLLQNLSPKEAIERAVKFIEAQGATSGK